MQLFICNFEINQNILSITDQRVFHQLKNVLRASQWYEFEIQNNVKTAEFNIVNIIRYRVKLVDIQKDKLVCEILEKQDKKLEMLHFWMIIAMLNKFDKVELIVQKLSEIWIPNIVFVPTQRSVVKDDISQNKLERLKLISLEAVEQSKWWIIPDIIFTKDFKKIIEDKKLLAFDFDGEKLTEIKTWDLSVENLYWIIWPEWWFDPKDYEIFWDKIVKKINIGDSVLRVETWTIIAWWLLKNLFR